MRGRVPGELHLHRSGREHRGATRISGAERYAKVYNIDYNRCIFCGYCVEACPTDAITHGHGFEMASYNASNLVYRKEQLLAGTPAHKGANAIYSIEGTGRLMPKPAQFSSGADVPPGYLDTVYIDFRGCGAIRSLSVLWFSAGSLQS